MTKADLIRDFNLHTVLRLPDGVFAPYTDTGRVRQSSYEAQGQTRYCVDLLADGIAILAMANGKATDEERV